MNKHARLLWLMHHEAWLVMRRPGSPRPIVYRICSLEHNSVEHYFTAVCEDYDDGHLQGLSFRPEAVRVVGTYIIYDHPESLKFLGERYRYGGAK